jgi:hypothetical protein
MKDNQLGAIALFAGALIGVIVLLSHPGGAHRVTPDQVQPLIVLIISVHALAIASLPISFLGALVLSREAVPNRRLGISALVIFGFASVATMGAATMSGLVVPAALRHLITHDAAAEQWQLLLSYTHTINQGFAQIGAVGLSVAIIIWSIALMKRRALNLVLGIYGLVLGIAVIGALVSGAAELEMHGGFEMITLGQSIWFILAAVLLWLQSKVTSDEQEIFTKG